MNDELERRLQKAVAALNSTEDYVSPLQKAVNVVKGTPMDTIDTKNVQKLLTGSQFQDKIKSILESRAAAKMAKTASGVGKSILSKGIPVLGGLAVGLGTALTSGDASAGEQAATPFLSEAEDLGPSPDSLEHKMESGTATPDELDQLRKRFQ